MNRKRILSLLLTVCMVLTLIPAAALPARAFDDPVYRRVSTPEVAILNFYTGNNEAFLKKQISVPIYNAVADLKFVLADGGTTLLSCDDTISKDSTYVWKAFYNSPLAYLSDRYQELQCGFSVTRKSNSHTHRWQLIYSADMTSYINAYCYLEDPNNHQSWNIAMYRSFSSAASTLRQGVKKYSSLGYTVNGANSRYATINGVDQRDIRKNLYLSFSNSSLNYDGQKKTCSCGGSATGAMVSFYDGRVPSIESVEFRDGNGSPCANFKEGDTMNIVIKCTDAIRFADDSAVGKGSVYIGLMADGEEKRLYAHLTRLDEDSMTFTYKVGADGIKTINGIDLTAAPATTVDENATALIHKTADITLKQIYGGSANRKYSPKLPDETTDPLGFTMTTSHVTDIAGNAFAHVIDWENSVTSNEYLLGDSSRVYLDCQAPFVAKAALSADCKNGSVKEALGKQDLAPDDPDYTDNSDSYLGVGDTFSLTLYMNEVVTGADAEITTNIRNPDGSDLTLTAASVGTVSADNVGDQYGLGVSRGQVSVFYTDPVTIADGMTVSGSDCIMVTGVTFSGVDDASGNSAVNGAIGSDKQNAKYRLDTQGALPVLGSAVQTGVNESFTVSFTITDAGAGVQDLPATLTLRSGDHTGSGDHTSWFWYVVSIDGAAPEPNASAWTAGAMGTPISFTQSGGTQYLHIRPMDGESYAFYGEDARLLFDLSDYAGNKGGVEMVLDGVILDNVKPAFTAGNSTRSYDASRNTGTLTAQFLASDPGGLKKVEYQWSAYTVTSDTQLIELDWADVPGVLYDAQGAPLTSGDLTVSGTVAAGEDFHKNLWVRAEDQAGNVRTANLGEYRYNLSGIQYDLEYPAGISTRTYLYPTGLEDGGRLLLIARIPGQDFLYMHYLDESCPYLADASNPGIDILNARIGTPGDPSRTLTYDWYPCVSSPVDGGVEYFFSSEPEPTLPVPYNFTGNLEITGWSGNATFITRGTDGDGKPKVTVLSGAGEETIHLRRSYNKNSLADVFDGKKVLSMSDADFNAVTAYVEGYPWRYYDEHGVSATLEGRQVLIDLGNDVNGWDYADIDWTNSFIALCPYDTSNQLPDYNTLKTCRLCAIGSGPSQTVTLPASDLYKSGCYALALVLARRSAMDACYTAALQSGDWNARVYIDDTQAGSLALGMLLRETTQFGGYTEEISYDPDSLIYIPAEGNTVRLMVEALNADGSPVNFFNVQYNFGAMDILAWNTADPSVKVSLDGADSNPTGNRHLTFAAVTGDRGSGILGVTPGEKNVIALQVRWANGRTSAVTYLTVLPMTMNLTGTVAALPAVDESTYGPFSEYTTSGLLTTDPGEARIVFTPKAGSSTAGLRLFCQEGSSYHEATVPIYETFSAFAEDQGEMTPQSDGTYIYTVPAADAVAYQMAFDANMDDPDNCPWPGWYTGILLPNGSGNSMMNRYGVPAGYYVVFAQDAYGNMRILGITKGAVIPDGSAPLVTADSLTTDPGSYKATFTIRDDSLYSFARTADGSWMDQPVPRPMTLTLTYDEAYAERIGAKGESLTLTADAAGEAYTWTETDGNKLGIRRVTAALTRSGAFEGDNDMGTYFNGATDAYLTVTVEGLVSPLVSAGTSMTLCLTAEDAHGNRADPVKITGSVSGTAPAVTAMQYKETGSGTDRALYLTFNTPVQPEASWICPEPQGFRTEWHDAFPIWKDGTWTIRFIDQFGTRYAQDITLTDVFKEYGIDLSFSTLEATAEPVVITAAADEDGETVVIVGGDTVMVNGDYPILRIAGGEEDELTVHITNIVSGDPAVTLYFYLEEFKEQYTAGAADQFRGITTAPVIVSCSTDRETSSVGASALTFRSGDDDSFTFEYCDVPTQKFCSVSGRLSDYGITIAPPEVPYVDTQAPVVELVTIWTQRGKGFVQAEAFPGSADENAIKSAIHDSGYAQSYNFVVSASDYSRWTVTVTAAKPTGTSFAPDTAVAVNCVEVQGNNVLVKKGVSGSFYLVVSDEAGNYTCLQIPADQYQFDTTAPEITTRTVADSLYQRSVYIAVSDKADNGDPTTGTVLSGAGVVEETATMDGVTYTHKLIFRDNDTVAVVTATDGAGNSVTANIQVSGIDMTAPVLSVTWSPCFKDPNTGKLDPASPSAGPVNTDVVAHIVSSKDIRDVSAFYTAGGGTETPYDFNLGAGWGRIEFTSQRVTVFFTDPAEELLIRLVVTAPNGKSTETSFLLNKEVIDKVKPAVVSHTKEQAVLAGYTVPHAETHTLSFSEDVYCMNYGQAGVVYNEDHPFTLTMTDNGEELVQFADRAGNLITLTLASDGLDSTAPALSLDLPDGADATSAAVTFAVTADEPCVLTASEPGVTCSALSEDAGAGGSPVWTGAVTVNRNGTFRLTAADRAGNETSVVFTVNNIDRTMPNIYFAVSTVSLRQGSGEDELLALLNPDSGITLWDNVEVLTDTLRYDASQVLPDVPGIYPVTYTVEDTAGNVGQTVRWVRIIDKNRPAIAIDGVLTESDGTTGLHPGEHVLAVSGLKAPDEPYSLKLVKGIRSAGQMKRASGSIPVGEDGGFTLTETGFYTLFIITQSRQTYRTLLYVEN